MSDVEGPLLSRRDYEARDFLNAWRDIGLAIARAYRLPQVVAWLDGHLARVPRLYRWLSR